MSRISAVHAAAFVTPLHNPFVTSRGRATAARAVAVHLTLEDGRVARGESVPVTYVTGETIDSVLAAVQQTGHALVGQDAAHYRPLFNAIAGKLPDSPSARCALEMAALDAWSQITGVSLDQLLGGALPSVESDITIPIVPNAYELAELAWELGIQVFKIKVGDASIDADHARIAEVRRAAPGARIRIDANQAFTPESALFFVERLVAEGVPLELLEQPVPREDFAGLAWVSARSPVPVFADESVRTPEDGLQLIAASAVQGFNLKINKNGIAGALDLIALAQTAGLKLMLGCMLETRRSIAVSLALACGTGAFQFIDLDSHMLLNEDGENSFFRQQGACLALGDRAG